MRFTQELLPSENSSGELTALLDGYLTIQDSVSSVASFLETIIVQYTVPVGMKFALKGGSASGMTRTRFKLYVDNVLKETRWIAWTDRNTDFGAIQSVPAGTIIKITCYHKATTPHDFDASIFGILYS